MALGNNLNKKKRIPKKLAKESKNKPKSTLKNEIIIKKARVQKPKPRKSAKKLLAEANPTAEQKKGASPKPTKVQVESTAQENLLNYQIPVFIAKELFDKKKSLRKKYQVEIETLKNKSTQFILMSIGKEYYAIEIDLVKEVVPIGEISKIPNTPAHIRGISNVRGSAYVVFDLSEKFNIQGEEVAKYLLVLNNSTINSCLMVSTLPSTLKINGSNIFCDLQTIEDAILDASYIKGLIHECEQLIYLLDIIELIKNEKAIVVPDNLFHMENA